MAIESIRAALRRVEEQLGDLRTQVFEHPPQDWPGFQLRLGAYVALTQLRDELRESVAQED